MWIRIRAWGGERKQEVEEQLPAACISNLSTHVHLKKEEKREEKARREFH